MTIGVLALQGSVIEHLKMIKSVNKKIDAVPVKTIDELATVDGLIIPGGESTTLRRLMEEFNLYTPIRERIVAGMPVWGTCAGLILLANRIEGENPCLSVLDIDVKRNGYGRHSDSFVGEGDFDGMYVNMVFIRAPYITRVGEGVEVLAECNDRPVAVRSGNVLATAFHPEMTRDNRIHKYFIGMIDAKV
ncbi:MAG: pyridoxal 5'-phosphate synthase glutaminase subunit PdxT [Clostridiales bacterium]|nr:pyridoxal 5'-phosphate synthase glutaminase subunit PdxT [Clostridiales bacterium]MDE6617853.1 pyridoxal 5'-phosphate synthase glutaminase subunit PdxT [Clostridiales bacterium]